MASTKTKFRCKQQLGKLKEKAKKTVDLDEKDDRDKTDREDSGVQLDDPVVPSNKSWESCDSKHSSLETTKARSNIRACLKKLMNSGTSKSSDQLSIDYGKARVSADGGAISARISKSESPRIKNCKDRNAITASATMKKPPLLTMKQKSKDNVPRVEVTHGGATVDNVSAAAVTQRPHFVLYTSDNDSDREESQHKSLESQHKSQTPTQPVMAAKSFREREKERSRARFRRMLRPLRRSHSAGCNQDVPVHALFLKHDTAKLQLAKGRRSVDGGQSSMDRHSSSSDTDEPLAGDKKSSSGSIKTKKKSLAKDVKDKLSFLRRRHTDTALSSKDAKYKASPESALHWSKSFENLLMDKQGLDLFREFLRTEFSEENIEFWIACEDYKNIHSNKLNTEAQRIYTDFIAVQAPHEINLDSKTRMLTIKNISSPCRQTFEGAQRRIQALMEKDSYRRFLHSDIYQDLLGAQRANFSPP